MYLRGRYFYLKLSCMKRYLIKISYHFPVKCVKIQKGLVPCIKIGAETVKNAKKAHRDGRPPLTDELE